MATVADTIPCEKYVARRLSAAVEANRIRQDILQLESFLERAEAHARRIRNTRDGLVAQLLNLSD